MNTELLLKPNIDETLTEEFKIISTDISLKLNAEGIPAQAHLPGLPAFSQASLERKQQALNQVRFYQQLCNEQLSEGYKVRDTLSLTWRALRQLNLVPTSEIFGEIRETDVVEVYSTDHVQLFRNFSFFDFCSYTLEELSVFEWWLLFERDQSVTESIISESQKIFPGDLKETLTPNIPRHVLKEIRSSDRLMMSCEIRRMSPLFKNRQVAGIMVLEEVHLVSN